MKKTDKKSMKKSIINKNYSLLILVLLILYITYTNLPPDKINIQTGGYIDPNSPFFGMNNDKLSNLLAKNSMIYSILNNYFWIYVIINICLILVAALFAYTQISTQGIPGILEPDVTWDGEGMHFFNFFYLIAKEKYNLFSPGISPGIKSSILDTFENDFDNFVLANNGKAQLAIDTFCDIISPCNTCECTGPDPNYGGLPIQTPSGPDTLAPDVPYGLESLNGSTAECSANGSTDNLAKKTQEIIKMQKKRGIGDLVLGRIPDCCCHLWKSLFGDSSNFTLTNLNTYISSLNRSTPAGNFGLPAAAGCEPDDSSRPADLRFTDTTGTTTLRPHVKNGDNVYKFNMVKSCLIKNGMLSDPTTFDITATPAKYPTITTLSTKFIKCATYDTDLDEGISYRHAEKNKNRYAPTLNRSPSSSSSVGDAYQTDWTSGVWTQTTRLPPNIIATPPADWPNTTPFTLQVPTAAPWTYTKLITNRWYISSSNIKYQLKINTRLYEIIAYPVINIDPDIYTMQITDVDQRTFLDSYLSPIKSDIYIFGGAYYFP